MAISFNDFYFAGPHPKDTTPGVNQWSKGYDDYLACGWLSSGYFIMRIGFTVSEEAIDGLEINFIIDYVSISSDKTCKAAISSSNTISAGKVIGEPDATFTVKGKPSGSAAEFDQTINIKITKELPPGIYYLFLASDDAAYFQISKAKASSAYVKFEEIPSTYTLRLYLNDGTDYYDEKTEKKETKISLPTATRTGHTFNGWYTAPSDGSKVGDAGEQYTIKGNASIYAHWTINKLKITYKENEGNPGSLPPSESVEYGSDYYISAIKPTKDFYVYNGKTVIFYSNNNIYDQQVDKMITSYTFDKWKTENGTPYQSGGKIENVVTDITLYAQWSSGTSSQGVQKPSVDPTKEGYVFSGWSTSKDTKNYVTFPYHPQSDITLYAIFEPNCYVYIKNKKYMVNIYINGQWKEAIPYVYSNNKWKIVGN